ncbi:carboxypeptidase-like regulatory domain-containing protein [Fulvivirgaceae bacterium LMO-SS25]
MMKSKFKVLSVTFLSALFIGLSPIYAQNQAFKFKILDENEVPLAFANIQVDGQMMGAVSDMNGKATLILNSDIAKTITVSFVGYISQNFSIADLDSEIENEVRLIEDEVLLAELQVIDIGEEPNSFIIDVLSNLYDSYPKKYVQSKQNYHEVVIENGQTTFEGSAEIILSHGRLNRERRKYIGKEPDEYYHVETLQSRGEPDFHYAKDIPILQEIIEYVHGANFETSSWSYHGNSGKMKRWIENLIFNQQKMGDIDWRITKLQKSNSQSLLVIENNSTIKNHLYDPIKIRFVCSLEERMLLSVFIEFERIPLQEPILTELPEFKDREEYKKWIVKDNTIPKLINLSFGSGQALMYFHKVDGTTVPKNFYLNSTMHFPTEGQETIVQLQVQQNMHTINLKGDYDTKNYTELSGYSRSNPWWKQKVR